MRRIKQLAAVSVFVCAAPLVPALGNGDEPVVPPSYSIDRYKLLFDRFPFGREAQSQPAPPPPQGPGLADKWQLTGHFMIGSIIYVNVLNRQSQQRQTLSSDEKNQQSMKVVSLQDDPDPYNVKVVVQLDGQTGTLGFDRPQSPKTPVAAASPVVDQQQQAPAPGQMPNAMMKGTAPPNMSPGWRQQRNMGTPAQ